MIVVDWGTTYLRAYRLSAAGDIEARKLEPKGVMSVAGGAFAAVLDEVLADWRDSADDPILMSGMIGSRQGWFEVPYIACPAGLQELAAGVKAVPANANRAIFICPGLVGRDAEAVPDVMRGEEVQIFGALSTFADSDAVTICLPGTHSKHALVRNNKIERFLTHMTGEVFALLRDYSILGRLVTERRPNLDAFDDGLRRARQGAGLLHHVFGVRARVLMDELDAADLTDYLSGILIGHELSSSPLRPPVVIVGEPSLCALYGRALAHSGTGSQIISAEMATTRGLHAIAKLVGKEVR